MEGLDALTADRLDELADSWSGPGAAQTDDEEDSDTSRKTI
jgi:hypothetical protein